MTPNFPSGWFPNQGSLTACLPTPASALEWVSIRIATFQVKHCHSPYWSFKVQV